MFQFAPPPIINHQLVFIIIRRSESSSAGLNDHQDVRIISNVSFHIKNLKRIYFLILYVASVL